MHDPKRFQTLWHDWNDNGMRAAALGGVGGALIPVQSDDTRGAVEEGAPHYPILSDTRMLQGRPRARAGGRA